MTETVVIERRDTKGRFVVGNKPPGGRPLGSRNRLSEDFLRDLSEAWREHGPEALRKCFVEEPAKAVGIVAQLMPRHAELSVDIDVKTEITALLADFRGENGRIDRGTESLLKRLFGAAIEHDAG